MPDINQQFIIKAPLSRVLEAVSTQAGLDTWWTLKSSGTPQVGSEYQLDFGPDAQWAAVVTRSGDAEFELELTRAQDDWLGTRVGFELHEKDGITTARFHHTGWPEGNDHYHISCYCWAMYLRLLKRYVEHGEVVPYDERLEA